MVGTPGSVPAAVAAAAAVAVVAAADAVPVLCHLQHDATVVCRAMPSYKETHMQGRGKNSQAQRTSH